MFPREYQNTVFYRSSEIADLPWYLSDEMSLLVFGVWLVVPLLVGYLQFDRLDLE